MPRPISTTSRKPFVHTMAAFGSRRVISALVATVVPWQNRAVCARSIPASPTPVITPSIGSAVEATLATSSSPLAWSRTHTSVNVPPTSTATTRLDADTTQLLRLLTCARTGGRPLVVWGMP